MGFFHVRFCFLGRELDRPFDAVKLKTNHILCCAEVPIALLQFLFGDRVLPLRVYRDCRRREDGLNAMDGCSSEGGDVGSILQLGSSIAEVVDIDLQTFVGRVGLARMGTSWIVISSSMSSTRRAMSLSTKYCVRSQANSVTVQNRDGLSTHPICTAARITIQHGSDASCGST